MKANISKQLALWHLRKAANEVLVRIIDACDQPDEAHDKYVDAVLQAVKQTVAQNVETMLPQKGDGDKNVRVFVERALTHAISMADTELRAIELIGTATTHSQAPKELLGAYQSPHQAMS